MDKERSNGRTVLDFSSLYFQDQKWHIYFTYSRINFDTVWDWGVIYKTSQLHLNKLQTHLVQKFKGKKKKRKFKICLQPSSGAVPNLEAAVGKSVAGWRWKVGLQTSQVWLRIHELSEGLSN